MGLFLHRDRWQGVLGDTWRAARAARDEARYEDLIGLLEQRDVDFEQWLNIQVGSTKWLTPTLTNSWVAFGAGWATPRYRRVGDMAYVEGMIKDGTSSVACLTLPVGFRPPNIQVFSTMTSTGAVRLDVGTNGQVVVYAGGAGVWASINCSFSTLADGY